MLQDIRKNFQGTFAKVIIAIICVPFVLFGVESLFSSGSGNKVAEVNGEAVTAQELNEAVYLRKRQLISQMGDNIDPTMLEEDQLIKPALESLVKRKLILQAAEEKGLAISDAQFNQAIRNTPDFQVDGKFSQERFQNLLNVSGLSSSIFKRLYSSDLLVNQYTNGVIGTGFVTDAEVDINARFTHETRDIRYIQLTLAKAKKGISASDDQVKAYYDENPSQFQSEESVVAEYIELNLEEYKTEATEEEIKAAYDEEVVNAKANSSKIVSHILIEVNDQVSETKAMERLAEVQTKLAAGESFAELAKANSDDLGSKEIGGLLGELDEAAFPEAFVAAAVILEEKQVSEIIETDAGLHLIELTEITEVDTPSFDARKKALAEELAMAKAEPKFWEEVENLKDVSFNAADLVEPARSVGKEINTTAEIKRSTVNGTFANADVLSQLFSPSLTNEGLNSEVVELDEERIIVFRVKTHSPQQLVEFNVVKAKAKNLLLTQLATEALTKNADSFIEQLKAGGDIEAIAKESKLDWQLELAAKRSSVKTPREIISAAFRLPAADKTQQAVSKTQLNNGDIAILSVNDVKEGSSTNIETYERQAVKGFLARARAASALQSIQSQFEDQSDIEYYR